MTDPIEKPIVIDPNPTLTQINTALRDLALVAAAIPALTAMIGKHDVLGLVNWASSSAAAPVISILATTGIFVWRQVHARRNRAEKVVMAEAAPNSVAVVKGGEAVG